MASAGTERRLGMQEGTAVGPAPLAEEPGCRAQSSECPVTTDQCLVPVHEACGTQGEDKCPTELASEPEFQEKPLKREEDIVEERGPRPMASVVRPSQSPKRKPVNRAGPSHNAHPRSEAEISLGSLLQREEPEGSQSELSPSAKQHKKAKKRKSLGAPALPAAASTVPAPSETLGLDRKAQRLRPLYQYINYYNPELNQAGEGDREAEAEVEPELEMAMVPEEKGVEQLQALLPVAEAAGEEPGSLPSLQASSQLKAEVDKSTQVDINKMLSVCAAPLVPPLSPQYK